MMTYPKVSIIILNWNGLEDTIECLESLKKITYPNYEVILVDNGSRGNDAQVLQEKFSDYIRLIKNDKNYGYAKGNNIGIRHALSNSQPDYILLLNNDTVVDPEFLTEMVKLAEADHAIGLGGARIYSYDRPAEVQHFIRGKINLWRGAAIPLLSVVAEKIKKRESNKEQWDQIKEVDWVTGCSILIKSAVIESIGLLDEDFFLYGEDVDYCARVTKHGYKITYVPKAKVWHKLGQSTKTTTEIACYYRVRNRFRFMRKHATRWQYQCFQIYFFGFYFWLATGYYLIYLHSLSLLTSFYRGVKDGLFNSEASAKLYRRD